MRIGYARESTTKQVQDQALEWQIKRLQAIGCDRILSDRMSGASTKRPGYRELVKLVEDGRATEVVVCSLSRLGRSLLKIQEFIDLCLKKGVKLTTLDGMIDLNTAPGRANVQLQAVFAELERGLISERITAGYEGIRAARRPIHAPFGYKIINKELQIDREVEAIARELRRVAIDRGLTKACQWINSTHPDLPKVARTPGGIKAWLSCETLYGHLMYGRRSHLVTYRNNHPALFTEQERLEVEQALKFRHKAHGFKSDPIRFPFSGLVVCGVCGANMQVSYQQRRPFTPQTTYYRCIYGVRKKCPNNTYTSVAKIQAAAIAALIARADEIATQAAQQGGQREDPKLAELRMQLAALERLPGSSHIEGAIAGIRADIAAIEADTQQPLSLQPERERVLKAVIDPAFWDELKPHEKAPVYRLLIKSIECQDRGVKAIQLWI